MNRKISVTLFATVFFLTSCGAVTPIPPTPTATLTSTPTRTMTPTITPSPTITATPIPPEEATRIAFESAIANLCPTTTPAPQTSVPTNVLTDSQVLREFAGSYSLSTGFWVFGVVINCDGTFLEWIFTDTGDFFVDRGQVFVQSGRIHAQWLQDGSIPASRTFIPVRWGQRRYLIEEDRVKEFCEATKTTDRFKEPRGERDIGYFYLRNGDSKIKVTVLPILPSGKRVCP